MSLIFLSSLLFLILLSAFFSMSETALVSLTPQKAKALAINNPAHQRELLRWFQQPHELLTVILTGNTLVNILFASLLTDYAFSILANWNRKTVDLISWFLSTVILVVLGEMVPKILARRIPEQIALFSLPWLSRIKVIVTPITTTISSILEFFVKSPQLPKHQNDFPLSSDDLKSLLEEERNTPEHSKESVALMRRTLEIHDRRIENIMTPLEKIDYVDINSLRYGPMTMDLMIDLVTENGHTRTPIKKDGRFIGFVHTKDVLMYLKTRTNTDLISMIRQPLDMTANTSVRSALDIFQNSGVHIAFVYNSMGQIVGLVTLEDVLEEITGEILDEYDVAS